MTAFPAWQKYPRLLIAKIAFAGCRTVRVDRATVYIYVTAMYGKEIVGLIWGLCELNLPHVLLYQFWGNLIV